MKGGKLMKWVITQILISVAGIILFATALTLELSDITTFLLATLGLFLMIIGLTFKGLIKAFSNLV